tara:strand:- start:7791 stop:8498 length:708 start_codon:yes stop_codon:yes gene_type:complete
MSDEQNNAPDVSADASVASNSPDVAAMQAQMEQMQQQVQAMQSMHQQSMQNMMSVMSQQRQQPHWDATPTSPPTPNFLQGLDEDDPYFQNFKALAQEYGGENQSLKSQVKMLSETLSNIQFQNSKSDIENRVTKALEKHKVPEELADKVRTVAYAAMAQGGNNGQNIPEADALVGDFMQSLGKYAEVARKKWTEEAKKPKPISVAANTAGIPDDKPKDWDEAKARSIALMQAMLN